MRLIDYVPLGSRFNSSILNLIINSLKKNLSNPKHKQVILATVGPEKDFFEIGFKKLFKNVFLMHDLNTEECIAILQRLGFRR